MSTIHHLSRTRIVSGLKKEFCKDPLVHTQITGQKIEVFCMVYFSDSIHDIKIEGPAETKIADTNKKIPLFTMHALSNTSFIDSYSLWQISFEFEGEAPEFIEFQALIDNEPEPKTSRGTVTTPKNTGATY